MKTIIALGTFPHDLHVPGVAIEHLSDRRLSEIGTVPEQMDWLKSQPVDGYCGTNDIAALEAAICSGDAGQIDAVLTTQNKYSARQVMNAASGSSDYIELAHTSQQKSGFIKPVRSSLSFGANTFASNKAVETHIAQLSDKVIERNRQFSELAAVAGASPQYMAQLNEFIVETAIKLPEQCTVDGFVQNGQITIIGATKSVMHENNFSFLRFDFPLKGNQLMLEELYHQTKQAVVALGLDNTLFNCELKFDSRSHEAAIIEMNARTSMQFRPLFMSVTGWDIAVVAVQIAANIPASRSLTPTSPDASIHILRRAHDAYIFTAPTRCLMNIIEKRYKGSLINSFFLEKRYLSSAPQDGKTFRYAQVFMPEKGDSLVSFFRLKRITRELGFVFVPTHTSTPPQQTVKLTQRPRKQVLA